MGQSAALLKETYFDTDILIRPCSGHPQMFCPWEKKKEKSPFKHF